jgi:hypothetical protein
MKRMMRWMGMRGAPALGLVLSLGWSGTALADRVAPPPPPAPKRLVEVPDHPRPGRPVDIDVRLTGGEGRIFYPGDEVRMTFRTTRDAFVLIYGIDTEGRTRLLYPRNPWDSHFVRGQVTHALPGARAGYRLVADGPPGEEFVIGLASDRPLLERWNDCWSGVGGVTEFERIGRHDYRVGLVRGDRFQAIDRVSSRLIEVPVGHGRGTVAQDYVSFYIGDPGYRRGPGRGYQDDDRRGPPGKGRGREGDGRRGRG